VAALNRKRVQEKQKEKAPFPFVTFPFSYPSLADNTCYTGYSM